MARRTASRDPARFSLAHGGKDRHPYPVPIKVYDETIRVLKSAVPKAKLGRDEEMQALQASRRPGAAAGTRRDRAAARCLHRQGASRIAVLGGRSVFGWESNLVQAGKRRSR